MTDLRGEFRSASRERQLRYVATAIHGFTVMARDPDASEVIRSKINNLIHYLAGHLMAMIDHPNEPLSDSRVDAIVELVTHLNSRLAGDIRLSLVRQLRAERL